MSDNILPFEIQVEIIKRISDVKSLIQYRSVAKPWKSFIDSSEFIVDHHTRHHNHCLLVRYNDAIQTKYVSIIDNDDVTDNASSFAQHKFPLTLPISIDQHTYFNTILYGSSKGLFCFYDNIAKNKVVLWNPSIRKSVTIEVPYVFDTFYTTIIGFGVSSYFSDPKLIKIQTDVDHRLDLTPRKVELYSLSTGEWRTLSSENLPRSSVAFNNNSHIVIDDFIFWLAEDRKYENGMHMEHKMIMLFDMVNEKFMEIYLPDNVTKHTDIELSLFKIRESLAVVGCNYRVERQINHVWMMEGGVSDSFTKMYTIGRPEEDVSVFAFRNNGNPIIGMGDDESFGSVQLFVYEPDSEQISPIGISGNIFTCYVGSYMETLLLLDH